jgi:halimadienyl-diphosphate synthase
MTNLELQIHELLDNLKTGQQMSSIAYDTAWIARLGDIDGTLGNQALAWLSENQLSDGSWGAEFPYYHHDRVASTLAAMLALTRRGRRNQDRKQIENGVLALERMTNSATKKLQADPNGATIGFEMIVPTLVDDAERLGIIQQQKGRILGLIGQMRTEKLAKLKGSKITRDVTYAYSSEMAGKDGQGILDIENLQEKNGSVGSSPSATAYYLLYLCPGEPKALTYLKNVINSDGGAPAFTPYDIFGPAWVVWNISLLNKPDVKKREKCKYLLDRLAQNWIPGTGISSGTGYSPKDSDDTSLVFEVLHKFGYNTDLNAVLRYEEEKHFRCYAMEANPSVSANIHVLGALKQAGVDKENPSVKKILQFLTGIRVNKRYWYDKWHASPYYPTSHAIIACKGYDDNLSSEAISWLLETQKTDGSWGFYDKSTAEETAYCIQALAYWKINGGTLPKGRITHGIDWLNKESDRTYPPLWIGKGLYCPEVVVKSAILSALGADGV